MIINTNEGMAEDYIIAKSVTDIGWKITKYASGELQATIDYTTNGNVDISTLSGSIYVSALKTFSLADLNLVSVDFANIELIEPSYSAWTNKAAVTKDEIDFQLISGKSRAGKTREYMVQVIGRWK